MEWILIQYRKTRTSRLYDAEVVVIPVPIIGLRRRAIAALTVLNLAKANFDPAPVTPSKFMSPPFVADDQMPMFGRLRQSQREADSKLQEADPSHGSAVQRQIFLQCCKDSGRTV